MSDPIPPAVVHPPAEPLPDIYESSAFPGAWRCWRCATFLHASNVEAHRARHVREDAIAETSREVLRACQNLTEDDLRELLATHFTNPIERLVAAIRARRALDQQDTPNGQENTPDVRRDVQATDRAPRTPSQEKPQR